MEKATTPQNEAVEMDVNNILALQLLGRNIVRRPRPLTAHDAVPPPTTTVATPGQEHIDAPSANPTPNGEHLPGQSSRVSSLGHGLMNIVQEKTRRL